MMMKRIWKCIFLGIFLIFFLNGIGTASDIKKADELFNKSNFQEALKEYDSVFKETTDIKIRWKAFFRACESLAHLFRYGEAAQKLISTPLPRQMPHHARILILKAEMLRNFLLQYSSIQRTDVIDDEERDVFRLTPDEIKAEIRGAYKRLWELRNKLVKMDIKKEGYFLDIKDIDFSMYPTLFDYLILSWTDFLPTHEASYAAEGTVKPEAALLISREFKRPVNLRDPPALLAAELLERASRFSQRGRLEAAERWRIKRLLLPLRHTNAFDLKDLAEDKTLYDYRDLEKYRNQAKDILLIWMEEFRTDEARAEAGYETAVILNSAQKLAEAVKLCEKIERNFPGTHASRNARALRSRIQRPSLSLQAKIVMPPADEALTITTRNIEDVYFRLYRINPEDLKNEFMSYRRKEYGNSYDRFDGWSYVFNLNWSHQDWGKQLLKSYLSEKSPGKKWSIKTEDKGNYEHLTKIVDPPPLETGIYLVFASQDRSFKIGTSLLSSCFLNVTDFVLVGTAGFTTKAENAYYDFIESEGPGTINDEGFHFYALNAKTGGAVDKADLEVITNLSRQSKRELFNLRTDKKGLVLV